MFKHWLTKEEEEIDKLHGIERKPYLGCMISVGASILFWSLMYWVWVSLF